MMEAGFECSGNVVDLLKVAIIVLLERPFPDRHVVGQHLKPTLVKKMP